MKNVRVRNFTPHPVRLVKREDTYCDDKNILHVKSDYTVLLTVESEGVARASQTSNLIETVLINDVPCELYETTYGQLQGLPDSESDTLFIVSGIAHQAARAAGRHDTVIPFDLVRDEDGNIVGMIALSR